MVYSVKIKNNKKSALYYIDKLKGFENGTEYHFKPGVNIIVGENGCGKTTLMNLIKRYLLVDFEECSRGNLNFNINALFKGLCSNELLDGVDVVADYTKNTFRLSHAGEKEKRNSLSSFDDFGTAFTQAHSSTGEGVLIALQKLFRYMFSPKATLTFDYEQFNNDELYGAYGEYVKRNRKDGDEYTILMDEPDRNLSIDNIEDIKNILSIHKEETQVIAIIHNPILIYSLSKIEDINFIEMTKGYIAKVRKVIDGLIDK